MCRRRVAGFDQSGRTIDLAGQYRRFMLELSERMGMTAAELGIRMSAAELTERRGLEIVRNEEQRRANERG